MKERVCYVRETLWDFVSVQNTCDFGIRLDELYLKSSGNQ
jgi:hypothetical protein